MYYWWKRVFSIDEHSPHIRNVAEEKAPTVLPSTKHCNLYTTWTERGGWKWDRSKKERERDGWKLKFHEKISPSYLQTIHTLFFLWRLFAQEHDLDREIERERAVTHPRHGGVWGFRPADTYRYNPEKQMLYLTLQPHHAQNTVSSAIKPTHLHSSPPSSSLILGFYFSCLNLDLSLDF